MAEMTTLPTLSCIRGGNEANEGWYHAMSWGWKIRTPQLAAPTGSGVLASFCAELSHSQDTQV